MGTAAGGVAGASLGLLATRPFAALAQPRTADIDLGNGFRVLTSGETNVLAVSASDGVALVDGGSATESAALLQRVAMLPGGAKVHTLFNTHWHPEQTGSNEALGKAGATIVAQMNTKNWLSTDVTWPWDESTTFEPLPEGARPNKTTFDGDRLQAGRKSVEYGYLRHAAHTDGDLYVFFPHANVLAVGDAVTSAGWQSIDWWTGGWIGRASCRERVSKQV